MTLFSPIIIFIHFLFHHICTTSSTTSSDATRHVLDTLERLQAARAAPTIAYERGNTLLIGVDVKELSKKSTFVKDQCRAALESCTLLSVLFCWKT